MKTLNLIFDGHHYYIPNADDDQHAPRHGDIICDADGAGVVYFTHDGEYVVAEDCNGPGYAVIHENEPDAAWTVVKACLSDY